MLAEKPKISIIDGLGEVGRSLLEYVLENDLSDYVMVVGMKLPALSFLSESQLKLFDDARVVFKQKNIYDPSEYAHMDRIEIWACWMKNIKN